MSGAYGAIGLASLVIGAMAIAQGLWMAITAGRPRWVNVRIPLSGRERRVGLAVIALGVGLVLTGASDIETVAFASLRFVGFGVFLLGVVFMVVAFRPRPSQ